MDSVVVCVEDNAESHVQTSAVSDDSHSHHQTYSAVAEPADSSTTSSPVDVDVTSVLGSLRGTNVRPSQRQQLACQHEVIRPTRN